MLIPFNKDDYEVVTTHTTCPFHQAHPGEQYAGCTCSGSYGLRKKPLTPEQIDRDIEQMRRHFTNPCDN